MVELPKLPPELKENSSDRLLWAKFISAERKDELEMIANQNSYIGSAFQQLEIISQDKQKRLEYEAREKAIRDHNQVVLEAVLRGKKEGKEDGPKEPRLENIFTTISILLELDTEHSIIIEKLEAKYQLPVEKAKEYIHQVIENSTN